MTSSFIHFLLIFVRFVLRAFFIFIARFVSQRKNEQVFIKVLFSGKKRVEVGKGKWGKRREQI